MYLDPTTPKQQRLWKAIVDCCQRDIRCAPSQSVDTLREMRHYKTRILYFTIRTGSVARKYVAKLPLSESDHDSWDPRREYEALVSLSRTSHGSDSWRVPEPMGFGVEPRFLVTRYAAGTCMRVLAEPGMRLWAREKDTVTTVVLCRRAGECLRSMRRLTAQRQDPAESVEDSILAFCDARLGEVARFYRPPYVASLCTKVGRQLNRLFAPRLTGCKELLAYHYGWHGDFSLQNFLVDGRSPLTLLDLEGFGFSRLNQDVATFRFRLEHLRLRPTFSNHRLTRCWQAFCECFGDTEPERAHLMISYAYKLLAHVAWLPNPQRRRSESARERVRNRLWARSRFAWLQRFVKADSIEAVWAVFWGNL